jgi:hypothetical protein
MRSGTRNKVKIARGCNALWLGTAADASLSQCDGMIVGGRTVLIIYGSANSSPRVANHFLTRARW